MVFSSIRTGAKLRGNKSAAAADGFDVDNGASVIYNNRAMILKYQVFVLSAVTFLGGLNVAFASNSVRNTNSESSVVSDTIDGKKGYNSWPMVQSCGNKIVCVYTRGSAHTISEGERDAFSKVSADGGRTWSQEYLLTGDKMQGEVLAGKGLDNNGDMLFWIRSIGKKGFFHTLYRTSDGINFAPIHTSKLKVNPMQITDIFRVENVGLMSLWFAGNYKNKNANAWGTLVSRDNGATWTQNVVEAGVDFKDWPTEPSAVYLGDGKILGIARVESGSRENAQFQLQSSDYGKTWTRLRTNITDVRSSTPTLIYDKKTDTLSNYYYQRGKGVLKRRTAKAKDIWDNPQSWPEPENIAYASAVSYHAGNSNATNIGDKHYVAYYSGDEKNTKVVVTAVKSK